MAIKAQHQVKFSVALKKAMKTRQLSLRQLALEADLEYAHVQRIAAGKVNLELSTIVALADGLNMTVAELFGFYGSSR
jgi:transcriptional regulator with XRE-family HTH domain